MAVLCQLRHHFVTLMKSSKITEPTNFEYSTDWMPYFSQHIIKLLTLFSVIAWIICSGLFRWSFYSSNIILFINFHIKFTIHIDAYKYFCMVIYVVLTVNSPSTFCCCGGACLSTIHDRATDSNNLLKR